MNTGVEWKSRESELREVFDRTKNSKYPRLKSSNRAECSWNKDSSTLADTTLPLWILSSEGSRRPLHLIRLWRSYMGKNQWTTRLSLTMWWWTGHSEWVSISMPVKCVSVRVRETLIFGSWLQGLGRDDVVHQRRHSTMHASPRYDEIDGQLLLKPQREESWRERRKNKRREREK